MKADKKAIEEIIDRLLWPGLLNKCPRCELELDYSGCDVVGDIADEICELEPLDRPRFREKIKSLEIGVKSPEGYIFMTFLDDEDANQILALI